MTDIALLGSEPAAAVDGPAPADAETKGERTRRRLLDLAVERFGHHGFRATSVTDITRDAGLTQAACYAYFGSKAELFRAAVDADAAALIDEAAEHVRGLPPRQLLPTLVLHLGAGLDAHRLTRRVLQGHEPEAVVQLIDLPALHQLGDLVATAIREGQVTGEVRADVDPDALGAGAEALVLGLTMSLAMGGGQTTERHTFGVVSAFDAMLKPAGR